MIKQINKLFHILFYYLVNSVIFSESNYTLYLYYQNVKLKKKNELCYKFIIFVGRHVKKKTFSKKFSQLKVTIYIMIYTNTS